MEDEEIEFDLKKPEIQLKKKRNLIKREKKRLKKLFEELDEKNLKVAENLIENASFMSVQLDELKEHITIFGVKESYMNGSNLFGYKESVESKTYNTLIKNYMNIIKQLNDLMPTKSKINEDDEFEKFNGIL